MQARVRPPGTPDPRSIESEPIPLLQLPYVIPDILDEIGQLRAQVEFLSERIDDIDQAIENCTDIETLKRGARRAKSQTST